VAAADGALIVVGGTSASGSAVRTILRFDPSSGQVRQLGTLPRGLTHAAAGVLNGSVYVLGGRGTVQGSQTQGVLAIDPRTGRVSSAGALPRALSDAGAATIGNRILLAGGRDAGGQVLDSVYSITASRSVAVGHSATAAPATP
jgi:N-acetylneuraminic acid mutarotase